MRHSDDIEIYDRCTIAWAESSPAKLQVCRFRFRTHFLPLNNNLYCTTTTTVDLYSAFL